MSEERVMALSAEMAGKQVRETIIRREKGSMAEVVKLDSEIMGLKREINAELRIISEEQVHELDIETDDTRRNR
ncbi:hypothetical protein HOJ44_07350 [Candidatus Bathyarchaeota archaeon]|nr:hypothetical protein [Candidatus Bathyarchaeota archaeon]